MSRAFAAGSSGCGRSVEGDAPARRIGDCRRPPPPRQWSEVFLGPSWRSWGCKSEYRLLGFGGFVLHNPSGGCLLTVLCRMAPPMIPSPPLPWLCQASIPPPHRDFIKSSGVVPLNMTNPGRHRRRAARGQSFGATSDTLDMSRTSFRVAIGGGLRKWVLLGRGTHEAPRDSRPSGRCMHGDFWRFPTLWVALILRRNLESNTNFVSSIGVGGCLARRRGGAGCPPRPEPPAGSKV